jgi:lipoprotein-anchoring transpeptidase ErfK/SrfK
LALVCVVALVVALSAVPAFAVAAAGSRGPVPGHAIVGVRDLVGLTEAQARAAITTCTIMPKMKPLTVMFLGKKHGFSASGLVGVNVDAMLAKAYSTTDTTAHVKIAPVYAVSRRLVIKRLAPIATSIVNRRAVNASRVLRSGRFVFTRSVVGRRMKNITTATNKVDALLLAEANANGAARKTATLVACVTLLAPKVTDAKLGKAILVDISQRRVYLYSGVRLERSYRCAVGMRGHSTPLGSFKITGKKAWPSWRNPGSAWAKNMPAVIGPGVNNPLGTRAIYISAPGIRLHGTSNTRSVGTAASHGCMRMLRRNVEDLFKRVYTGMPVVIVK